MESPPGSGRRLAFRAAAILAALLVVLAATEALLRLTRFGVYEPRRSDYHMTGEGELWFFDPKAQAPSHRWDGDPYGLLPPGARMSYELNEFGLRGPAPRKGGATVVVTGDSFTFGEGVPCEDTLVARVGRAIAARVSDPPTFVNAGIPGYGLKQKLERLPVWLDEFRPRVVLDVFVANDVIPDGQWPSPDDGRPVADDEWESRRRSSVLWRLVKNALERPTMERDLMAWYRSFFFGENRAAWEVARLRMRAIRDLCAANRARFAMVLFPIIRRLPENPLGDVSAEVAAECARLGVPFLDLTPALAVVPDDRLWVHPVDHHPNARAHELAAEAIAPFAETLLR